VLIIELIAEKISVNLESVEKKLLKVESKTGYSHRFSSARIDSKKPRGTDYQVLAQSLGAQTCRFVLIKSLIVNATMVNNFIQEQLISTDYIQPWIQKTSRMLRSSCWNARKLQKAL
jgi:hypothetical protein